MKNFLFALLIISGLILGFNIYGLKTDLNQSLSVNKKFVEYNAERILRPIVKKDFEFKRIFDTKKIEETESEKLNTEDKTLNKDGQLNQVHEGDTVFRLQGIMISKDLRFAVLSVVSNKKDNKIIRLFVGEKFKGYIVEKIFKDYIELSNGEIRFSLKIFKPVQN